MKNKRLILILSSVAILLLLPLLAMQFTTEVDWSFSDFVIMGFLLTGVGMLCELVLRRIKSVRSRILMIGFLFVVFFLIWAELAVGIFGTPLAGS
jgi:hypothetical protein